MTRYRPAREGRSARAAIARAEVEELKVAAAIHGLRGPTADGNYSTCCPFCPVRVHREDLEFKMTVKISGTTTPAPGKEGLPLSPEFGVWHCYRCHARGFADFRWMMADLPPVDPLAPLAPVVPVNLGPPVGFVPLAECERSVSMKWAPAYFSGRDVLEQARAVGAGAVARWTYRRKDGTTFEADEQRVVVPHLGALGGPWLGFSARLVRGRERATKYLYPPGMERRTALWGVPWLPRDREPVYIVEGFFDALPLFPYGVATLGSAITEEQLDGIAALARPVVACLDGDARALCRALARSLTLRSVDASWAELPVDRDPGTLGWAVRDYVRTLDA